MQHKDLEKRQYLFRTGARKPLPPHVVTLEDGTTLALRPVGTGLFSAIKGESVQSGMDSSEVPGTIFDQGDRPRSPTQETSSSDPVGESWEKL